jgi:hypothetical protein
VIYAQPHPANFTAHPHLAFLQYRAAHHVLLLLIPLLIQAYAHSGDKGNVDVGCDGDVVGLLAGEDFTSGEVLAVDLTDNLAGAAFRDLSAAVQEVAHHDEFHGLAVAVIGELADLLGAADWSVLAMGH